jgi:MFS family permease
MVIVNTVVLVRDELGRPASSDVALALGAAGTGSMLTALLLPRLLRRRGDRWVMLAGGALLPLGLVLGAVLPGYGALLAVWALLGIGLALVETPSGRLVQRSASEDDGPTLFAAQFSLSHACWLVTYPISGVLGAVLGLQAVAWILAALAAVATLVAARCWREPPASRAARPGPQSPGVVAR